MHDDLHVYLSGEKLYGDDFSEEQLEQWYKHEEEGYANLGAKNRQNYNYSYHAINRYHGFSRLKNSSFKHVLGLGSAYGDEFIPLLDRVEQITILDPSDAFSAITDIQGTPTQYVKPTIGGDMPFENGQFDLIVCLGVLHHIANVSHIIGECYRCLTKGGIMFVREPITSMGDWSKPRNRLTKNERGIPRKIFRDIVLKANFTIMHEAPCMFSPFQKVCAKLGIRPYRNKATTMIDAILGTLFLWNSRYHRTKPWHRFAPAAASWILVKQ